MNTVEEGSPAARAGIQPSDIILSFGNKPVESSIDLPRIVGATHPGSRVPVELWRNGASRTTNITVGELREEKVAALESPPEQKPAQVAPNRLGIVVSELTPQQRKELKLTHGLVVTDVGPAASADLRRGDVLLMLVQNGHQTELKSVQQLNKLLGNLSKGAVFTLQVRRGDSTAFVTVSGLADEG